MIVPINVSSLDLIISNKSPEEARRIQKRMSENYPELIFTITYSNAYRCGLLCSKGSNAVLREEALIVASEIHFLERIK